MNAAERLWRGLGTHDWAAATSQFQPNAVVEWPHAQARMGIEEYLARQRERAAHGSRAFTVARVVTEGRNVVVEGLLGEARCAGFYDLHDGLIAGAVEYWVGEPA
jgi:SnoaL-like protein